MKLTFAATVVLAAAVFGSAAGASAAIERQDDENARAALLLRGTFAASEEEPEQQAHGGRMLGAGDGPNGSTCTSGADCKSGYCNAGVCHPTPQCFSYDGLTNNIPVTQQCRDAKANCCTADNGGDACKDLYGTVCATYSQPACIGVASCISAGTRTPVNILPGSCNSLLSCYGMQASTVEHDSCGGNGDAPRACYAASASLIPGLSCNAEKACFDAKAVPTDSNSSSVCNEVGSCYGACNEEEYVCPFLTSIQNSDGMCSTSCCECSRDISYCKTKVNCP